MSETRHIPVMLAETLAALAPRDGGIYVDGTFGAGGCARAILEAARTRVFAIDRDPRAISGGAALVGAFPDRIALIEGRFSQMETLLSGFGVNRVDGVALDIGVSSMQIDEGERGFSFMRDGPLDMRMGPDGPTAADLANTLPQDQLTRIIGVLGEEKRARRVGRAIVAARPLSTTRQLAEVCERALGKARDGIHPATRTFQALRIRTNRELDELAEALGAAERLLAPGGRLAVVTFHSLEDRIVKRFFAGRSGKTDAGSRHRPGGAAAGRASFAALFRGHREPGAAELAANPRARSAKLRAGERTSAPPHPVDPAALGVPSLESVS